MSDKEIWWAGGSLDDLRNFPDDARRLAGHQLHRVQLGLNPGDWRPVRRVGPGVVEIRVHAEVEHRVFYVATFSERIYVLHTFQKKTQQTAQREIELGRRRFMEVLRWRREQEL